MSEPEEPPGLTTEELLERIKRLLNLCGSCTRCRGCDTQIWFIRKAKEERWVPYTVDGVNHFINCPESKQFRKGGGDKR